MYILAQNIRQNASKNCQSAWERQVQILFVYVNNFHSLFFLALSQIEYYCLTATADASKSAFSELASKKFNCFTLVMGNFLCILMTQGIKNFTTVYLDSFKGFD